MHPPKRVRNEKRLAISRLVRYTHGMSDAGQQITVRNGYGTPDTQATVLVPRRHKMEAPKVSVIMPVYNGAEFLRMTLDSVLEQTLKEIEIICVDDGSTDASVEILQEYAAKDDRFIILTQQNHFAGVARNAGMAVASGEYFSFLDSDDVFKPTMLEDAYNAGKRDGTDVVMFGHYECGATKEDIRETKRIKEEYTAQSPMDMQKAGKWGLWLTIGAAWNKLFRRAAVEKHKMTFLSTRCANDFTFVLTMSALAGRYSLLPEAYLYYLRHRAENLTSGRRKNFDSYLTALKALKDNLVRFGVYGKTKGAFNHVACLSCHYEMTLCLDEAEQERKLAEFGKVFGKALVDRVRSWTPVRSKRIFYRLRSMLRGLFTWG